jgi:hypothetical protein
MDALAVNPDFLIMTLKERVAAAALHEATQSAIIQELQMELLAVRGNLDKQLEANLLLKDVIMANEETENPLVEVVDASSND